MIINWLHTSSPSIAYFISHMRGYMVVPNPHVVDWGCLSIYHFFLGRARTIDISLDFRNIFVPGHEKNATYWCQKRTFDWHQMPPCNFGRESRNFCASTCKCRCYVSSFRHAWNNSDMDSHKKFGVDLGYGLRHVDLEQIKYLWRVLKKNSMLLGYSTRLPTKSGEYTSSKSQKMIVFFPPPQPFFNPFPTSRWTVHHCGASRILAGTRLLV